MKIAHVVEPFSSGIITFIIHLTAALPGHEHVVIHGTRTTEDEMMRVRNRFSDGVHFRVWKSADRSVHITRDLQSFRELVILLREEQPDVIHLHSAKAGFIGKWAGLMAGNRRIIYTPNGAPFLRTDIGPRQQRLYKILEKAAARAGGRVICCGQSERDAYLKAGITADYINNGIPVGVQEQSHPPGRQISVCFSAIITYQKNPAMFSAIARQCKESGNFRFTWIGNGSLRSEIDPENVHITGWLQAHESARALQQSDIYLSTSRWEGQPFSVLEAMNMCKCLLLYDCVGNRDLVQHGVNGFLFRTVDEAAGYLHYLHDNPEKIVAMGENSYEICATYHNITNTSLAYEQVYRELAENQ